MSTIFRLYLYVKYSVTIFANFKLENIVGYFLLLSSYNAKRIVYGLTRIEQ